MIPFSDFHPQARYGIGSPMNKSLQPRHENASRVPEKWTYAGVELWRLPSAAPSMRPAAAHLDTEKASEPSSLSDGQFSRPEANALAGTQSNAARMHRPPHEAQTGGLARFFENALDLQRLAGASRRFRELLALESNSSHCANAAVEEGSGSEVHKTGKRPPVQGACELLAKAMEGALEDIAGMKPRALRAGDLAQGAAEGVGLDVVRAVMRGVMAVPAPARMALVERLPRLLPRLRPDDRLDALHKLVRILEAEALGLVLGPLLIAARVGPAAGGIPWEQSGRALALLRGEIPA